MPKFKVADLATGKGFSAMTAEKVSKTCYDLVLKSLVLTGDLKESVFERWRDNIPKSDTFLIVDPRGDRRLTDPTQIPASSIIGFYRRFYPGQKSAAIWETIADWVCYHMVRSMDVAGSTDVMGGNNGERAGTVPTWSKNDVTHMFDWTGATDPKMHQGPGLPAPGSFGVNGLETYVAFLAPVATTVARLNWKCGR